MNATMMNGSDDRTQRSRSAPPAPVAGSVPQRTFVSTMNYEPKSSPQAPPQQQHQQPYPQQQHQAQGPKVIPIIHEAGSNSSKNSTPQANRPQQNQQQHHQDRQQPDNSGSGVRIIPIHVEGRDQPVIGQQPEQQQSGGKQKGSRPPNDDNDSRKCSSPNQTPPMKKPALPVSPLDVIQQTYNEVLELEKVVDQAPGGSRHERACAELEEILTRKLLQLDNVDTEGREDIRQARKDCIKYILNCLEKLEAKYPSTPATAGNTCRELELAHPQNDVAKTDADVVAVQQPLAQMAVENEAKTNGNTNTNAIQPTAIPLPPPVDNPNEPKKSSSQNQVVSMEVTLAPPNNSPTKAD